MLNYTKLGKWQKIRMNEDMHAMPMFALIIYTFPWKNHCLSEQLLNLNTYGGNSRLNDNRSMAGIIEKSKQ